VLKALQSDRWDGRRYLLNRLTRLYVVLLPALLLAALFDLSGMRLFGMGTVYGGLPAYAAIVPEPVAHRTTLPIWLGDLFYLQEIRVPTFGSNGALWSLSYEFWYYLLFPACALAFWPKRAPSARAGYALAGAILLLFVGQKIALYFLIWLMGTL